MRHTLHYSLLALFIVVCDQVAKRWAYMRLRLGSDISVIDGFFKLSYTENPGIAFGLFSDSQHILKIWLLAAISIIAIGLVVYFAIKSPPDKRLLLIALMFVLGGVIGNLIDRIVYGVVIDFIEFYIGERHWPNFNIADTAICVGAVLLSIDILREPKNEALPVRQDERQEEGASK
ncbi:MAG: signal peptidase II [Acidobacteriota bacterium]